MGNNAAKITCHIKVIARRHGAARGGGPKMPEFKAVTRICDIATDPIGNALRVFDAAAGFGIKAVKLGKAEPSANQQY
ncbi:hypothetical protein COO20_21815 [Thalassospira marina]|uniref:Uncharacterized protein n=1 Tax=Thalassospira marina TaxID=2048283 RepID=A0A2N3KGL9_9PROT|nr:hypothetical protein COO20_21815 [Thalassospira marina]